LKRENIDSLSPDEIARYSRHLVLPEVGMEGQLRLRGASVLIVGAGGLGSPLGLFLAAAGVGRLGLVDFDEVDLSTLQRQILYGTRDVGRPKVEAARERLEETNPCIRLETHRVRLCADNASQILASYDIVVDGTDNFATRFLVNDACVLLGKPNVYGSIFRFEGQASVFQAGRGPCYRCLYPEPPPPGAVPSCAEGGVLGIVPGIIGALQATEAIKLILGQGASLIGRLLLFDALEMRFRELKLRRDPTCPVCGDEPSITSLQEYDATCVAPGAGRDDGYREISVAELQKRLTDEDPPFLLDVRTLQEWAICRLEGAHLIPVHELSHRLRELDTDAEIVVYCHVGMRSPLAVDLLRRAGYSRARNLTGGIDAWASIAEPGMPRY
jgi:adenylyltransferase/sulfurtransferase